MTRRRFLNAIGGAIIGTAIALRLPDIIAPLNHLTERPRISFAALMDAYNKARAMSGDHPSALLVSKHSMEHMRDLIRESTIGPVEQDVNAPCLSFWESTLTDYPDIPDDVIQVHSRNGVIKGYYFA